MLKQIKYWVLNLFCVTKFAHIVEVKWAFDDEALQELSLRPPGIREPRKYIGDIEYKKNLLKRDINLDKYAVRASVSRIYPQRVTQHSSLCIVRLKLKKGKFIDLVLKNRNSGTPYIDNMDTLVLKDNVLHLRYVPMTSYCKLSRVYLNEVPVEGNSEIREIMYKARDVMRFVNSNWDKES